MLTILEIVRKTSEFFERKGMEQPRLNAELIVGHCLGLDRMQLYLQFERPLTEPELVPIREKVRRRGLREPLQYVLGTAPFHDLMLKVDSRVLVPRPETEQMAERIRERLEVAPRRIVDLGTGSGALALCLARAFPEAEVLGVDASPDALEVARSNAEAASLEGRVSFLRSDWYASVPVGQRFDLIVSNPPYLTEDEWASAAPEVRNHEPKMALISEDDGCGDLERIMEGSRVRLEPAGHLVLETGIHQHARLMAKAESLGYIGIESLKDWSDRDRFLWMRAGG
ncbi:MAG: peptide chain release factor N(5)-glutamine methyltransferase [Opitutaceae bacterium]